MSRPNFVDFFDVLWKRSKINNLCGVIGIDPDVFCG